MYETTPEGLAALRATLATWPESQSNLLVLVLSDDNEPDELAAHAGLSTETGRFPSRPVSPNMAGKLQVARSAKL